VLLELDVVMLTSLDRAWSQHQYIVCIPIQ